MIRVPVGDWADKAVVAEGKEMAMSVIVVNRQIEQIVEHHAETNETTRLPVAPSRNAHSHQRQGNRVQGGDRILPKRLIIALRPNLGARHLLDPDCPNEEDENGDVGQDATQRDRQVELWLGWAT